MKTIVVKVWRGMVSEVYSDDPDTEVIIIDEDTDEPAPEDTELPTHRVYQA